VRHLDGSFTLDREPFPRVANVLGCTTVGFFAGLVMAAPLTGAAVGALVGGVGSATSAAAAGIRADFIREVEVHCISPPSPGVKRMKQIETNGTNGTHSAGGSTWHWLAPATPEPAQAPEVRSRGTICWSPIAILP
jgi:hypothetical protein